MILRQIKSAGKKASTVATPSISKQKGGRDFHDAHNKIFRGWLVQNLKMWTYMGNCNGIVSGLDISGDRIVAPLPRYPKKQNRVTFSFVSA